MNSPHGLVIKPTPLGVRPDDPLPVDAAKVAMHAFVGDVMTMAPLIEAARDRMVRF